MPGAFALIADSRVCANFVTNMRGLAALGRVLRRAAWPTFFRPTVFVSRRDFDVATGQAILSTGRPAILSLIDPSPQQSAS